MYASRIDQIEKVFFCPAGDQSLLPLGYGITSNPDTNVAKRFWFYYFSCLYFDHVYTIVIVRFI